MEALSIFLLEAASLKQTKMDSAVGYALTNLIPEYVRDGMAASTPMMSHPCRNLSWNERRSGNSRNRHLLCLTRNFRWIVVLYNLTHIVGSVDASVQQDLPLSLQIIYFVIVTLWLVSLLRVLCTRLVWTCFFNQTRDSDAVGIETHLVHLILAPMCCRPGQPKDFQEGADPLPASNNWLFCIYCQAQ